MYVHSDSLSMKGVGIVCAPYPFPNCLVPAVHRDVCGPIWKRFVVLPAVPRNADIIPAFRCGRGSTSAPEHGAQYHTGTTNRSRLPVWLMTPRHSQLAIPPRLHKDRIACEAVQLPNGVQIERLRCVVAPDRCACECMGALGGSRWPGSRPACATWRAAPPALALVQCTRAGRAQSMSMQLPLLLITKPQTSCHPHPSSPGKDCRE